jgi:hypothetical protein
VRDAPLSHQINNVVIDHYITPVAKSDQPKHTFLSSINSSYRL